MAEGGTVHSSEVRKFNIATLMGCLNMIDTVIDTFGLSSEDYKKIGSLKT